MKKQILCACLTVLLLLCAAPTAATLDESELQITWYPQYREMLRLGGVDRMLARGDGGRLYLMNLYGGQISEEPFDVFILDSDGAATALRGGYWGRVDMDGNEIVPFQYEQLAELPDHPQPMQEELPAFPEGLRGIQASSGLWGYENEAGALVIPCVFEEAGGFDHGFALVRQDGVYGMLKNPTRAGLVSDWAQEEVSLAQEKGLLGGKTDSYFLYYVTRLQFAELMVNLVEQSTGVEIEPAQVDRFPDADDLCARKAAAASIIEGTGESGAFLPDRLITREGIAVMLCRAMEYMGKSMPSGSLAGYDDEGQVAQWARESMAALAEAEVIKGNAGGLLMPQSYATLEQAVLMALRAYAE